MTFIKIVVGLILLALGLTFGTEQIGMWSSCLKLGGSVLAGLGLRDYFQSKKSLK